MTSEKTLTAAIDSLLILEEIKKRDYVVENLTRIRERICDKEFRIAVVGEFSSGKSTFINALIGKDLLSHATQETTATITYIRNTDPNDKRIGNCDISFYDGTSKRVPESELMQYTTAQSRINNVADCIKSVTIYSDFIKTGTPIVIVDTPGLNGVADKHREITLAEVKKAHACIYLLQKRGISESDIEFIKILRNYQSRFVFIQNWIDAIHSSDGETPEGRIEDNLKIITEEFGDKNELFDFDICAISALQALAARDTNIHRLYQNSISDITSEERKTLWVQSRFSSFIEIINEMISSGSYRKAIFASAVLALENEIDSILPTLLANQELNSKLISSSERATAIDRAKVKIKDIEDNLEIRNKKLHNFLISRNCDNCDGLKKFAKNKLETILEELSKDIDCRIPDYDSLIGFANKSNHFMQIHEFYSNLATNMINTQIYPELNSRMEALLSALYDEAIQRISDYTAGIKSNNANFTVSITGTGESQEIDFQTEEKRISDLEVQAKSIDNEILKSRQTIDQTNNDLRSNIKELTKKQEEKKKVEQKFSDQILRLGACPEVKKHTEIQKKAVKRGGIFGWIADIFTTKYETVEKVVYDNSELLDWQAEYRKIKGELNAQKILFERKINSLQNDLDSCELRLKSEEARKTNLENKAKGIREQIRLERESYDLKMKSAKSEQLKIQKKHLKKSLSDKLFEDTNSSISAQWHIENYITDTSDRILETIWEKVKKVFVDSANKQKKQLQQLIDANEKEINSILLEDKKTIEALNTVKKHLNGGK